jgi:hypothetical protein
MRTLRYRALSTSLCTLILLWNFLRNGKNNWTVRIHAWLGSESNKQCLQHGNIWRGNQRADADHPLPSLIHLPLYPYFIEFSAGNGKKACGENSGMARAWVEQAMSALLASIVHTSNGKQMQTLHYRAFLPYSAASVHLCNYLGNGKKENGQIGNGSCLSWTGIICIIAL